MSQRILDEREHRRGLVLGLTLAEVLILLLFLLLLALGVRLTKLEQEKKIAEKEREGIKVVLDDIARHLPDGANHPNKRSAKQLASELRFAIWLKQKFPALAEEFDVVGDFVNAGVDIDPNAPPAALRVARDILRVLGPGASSEQLIALEKQVAELERKLASVGPKASSKSKPDKQPTLAERTMAILKRMDPKKQDRGEKGEHDWPPIITLSEARGYSFASGSAEVSEQFQNKLLTSVKEDLLEIIERYGVDVVEVVGHTDEQRFNVRPVKLDATSDSPSSTSRPVRFSRRPSNLDTALIPYLGGKGDLQRLMPSDNAGLGLARAASVVRVLLADERLRAYRILPLSGGQLIDIGDMLSTGSPGDVKERRRIEIRARRSEKSAQPWQGRVTQDAPAK